MKAFTSCSRSVQSVQLAQVFESTKGRECRGRGWLAKFLSIEYATKLTVDQLRCFFHRLLEHCGPFSLFWSYSASDDAISQDAIVAAGIRRLRP